MLHISKHLEFGDFCQAFGDSCLLLFFNCNITEEDLKFIRLSQVTPMFILCYFKNVIHGTYHGDANLTYNRVSSDGTYLMLSLFFSSNLHFMFSVL